MKTYKLHPELQKMLRSASIPDYSLCPVCDGPITEGFTTFYCDYSPATLGHATIPMLSYKTTYIADATSPTGCVEEEFLAVISTYQHDYDINITIIMRQHLFTINIQQKSN